MIVTDASKHRLFKKKEIIFQYSEIILRMKAFFGQTAVRKCFLQATDHAMQSNMNKE